MLSGLCHVLSEPRPFVHKDPQSTFFPKSLHLGLPQAAGAPLACALGGLMFLGIRVL